MLKDIFENGYVIYAYIILSAIGFVVRLILGISYKRLLNASISMSETENKLLKHLKKKYETCYNLDMSVYNVDTFVDKTLFLHKSCGILLSTWEKIGGQIILIELLGLPIIGIWSYIIGCGQDVILYNFAVGILLLSFLLIVDKSFDAKYIRYHIKTNVVDYLDNYYYDKLKNNSIMSSTMEERTKELIKTLSEVAAHKEKIAKKEESKLEEKVIEDVLKEFFT